ncbi:MAG TPA: oligosaccharide flippase family protein [Candidatus Binataceae bacterium]|nr:oligosaccharide flippase family protein [Candidatus Binataceae bacterium]
MPPASDKNAQTPLDNKFARSVRDNVMAEVVIQIVRVGGMVVLARALGAAQFGVFRVLTVIGFFACLVTEAGLMEALIQRKDATAEHDSTAWWTSLVLATLSAIALYVCAPAIASFMAMPTLTTGVRLLCLPVFLDCLSTTASAKLQRELEYRLVAAAEVIAEVAFVVVALLLLWTPLAQWSLMVGLAVRFAARAIAILVSKPYLPTTGFKLAALRDLRRFATSVWGGNLVHLLSANADFLLIGRLLGASALGFYSVAWDVLRFIPDRLYKVAGRVTFPAFCLLQDDNERLGRAYRDFFDYVARIVLPVVACAAVAAPELIGVVYGPQWMPVAKLLRMLALGLALVGLRNGIGSVYYAKDHPAFDIYLHGFRLLLIVIVVGSLASSGLVIVSAGMSGVETVIGVVGTLLACWLIELDFRRLAAATIPGLRLAVACGFATGAGKALASFAGVHGPLVLAFVVVPPAAIFYCLEASTLTTMLAGAFGPARREAAEISG